MNVSLEFFFFQQYECFSQIYGGIYKSIYSEKNYKVPIADYHKINITLLIILFV